MNNIKNKKLIDKKELNRFAELIFKIPEEERKKIMYMMEGIALMNNDYKEKNNELCKK